MQETWVERAIAQAVELAPQYRQHIEATTAIAGAMSGYDEITQIVAALHLVIESDLLSLPDIKQTWGSAVETELFWWTSNNKSRGVGYLYRPICKVVKMACLADMIANTRVTDLTEPMFINQAKLLAQLLGATAYVTNGENHAPL